MKPVVQQLLAPLLIACLIASGAATVARATIQEESCIEPDIEYPVPCDED
jgi:hypothetical protein